MKNKHLKTLWLAIGLLASPLTFATCRTDITPTTPDSRFTVNSDGTVTDSQTGLIWMRCSLSQTWDGSTCSGSASNMTWQDALQAAGNTTFAGFNDWHLPNIKELASIVELACYGPAINATIFPATPSAWFWSSSPYAYDSGGARFVDFNYGGNGAYGKDGSHRVRLVRAGQ